MYIINIKILLVCLYCCVSITIAFPKEEQDGGSSIDTDTDSIESNQNLTCLIQSPQSDYKWFCYHSFWKQNSSTEVDETNENETDFTSSSNEEGERTSILDPDSMNLANTTEPLAATTTSGNQNSTTVLRRRGSSGIRGGGYKSYVRHYPAEAYEYPAYQYYYEDDQPYQNHYRSFHSVNSNGRGSRSWSVFTSGGKTKK